ncbi:unnamed protein product [Sphagnum troendelagicum]|uniref:Uncharacterized protein n=1 Tax=Sphagnum jensenii TaxID=128206 RepID=A0ABP0VJZ5_9BRYO
MPTVSRLPARLPAGSAPLRRRLRRGALRSSSPTPIPSLLRKNRRFSRNIPSFGRQIQSLGVLCAHSVVLHLLLSTQGVGDLLLQALERKAEREVQCCNGGRLCISLQCSREAEPEARA